MSTRAPGGGGGRRVRRTCRPLEGGVVDIGVGVCDGAQGRGESGRAVVEQVEVCPSGAVQALQAWGTALPGGRARDNLVPKGVPTGRRTRYTCVQGAQSCVRRPIRGVRLLASRQAHDCRDAAQGLGLRRQADRAGTFEIFKDNKGEYRFRLKGRNGEIVATGESYPTKAPRQA